jgi:hypothetical protein
MAPRRRLLDRRTVLRGLLGGGVVTIGLPLFEAFLNDTHTAYAGGDALPKRFGIFFWGNGVLPDLWTPKGADAAWELSPTLQPLAEMKSKITVVSGMKVPIANAVPHLSGPIGLFTGAPADPKDKEAFATKTIDQEIAAVIGADTRFTSLEVGVEKGVKSLSRNDANSVNPAETSPHALFQRVFGPEFVMPGDTPIANPTIGLRKSVLDAVIADANRLQSTLGATDKARLDQHLTGIRSLELRLKKLQENPPSLAACKLPMAPKDAYPDVDGRPPISEITRAMADILAMAIACDQTRVFSLWMTSPVSNILFNGAPSGHHQLTHDEPSPQPEVAKILLQVMTELNYFLKAFDSIAEGTSTLLDHCAILATTDCSYGRQHLLDEYPLIVAGTANGALRSGLHYRSPSQENTSRLMLTLARAVGLTLPSFGAAEGKSDSGLSAIEV